jgi:hypothetical protein
MFSCDTKNLFKRIHFLKNFRPRTAPPTQIPSQHPGSFNNKCQFLGTLISGVRCQSDLTKLIVAPETTRSVSMRNMLLMSVAAAALIAGSGLASAQAPNQSREGTSSAPAARPSAPAEKMAPAEKIAPTKGAAETKAPDSGLKAGQAQQMESKPPSPQQAQDNNKDGMKSKSMGSETQSQVKPDGKTSLDAKADGKSSITGQAAAGGSANLSTKQRTTIRTVIRQQNVQPATNVNFSISVGSRVSDNVHFYPVPAELVRIQPHWRGYEFFMVGNQIIVVNPQTRQIVDVLEA